MSGRWSSQDDIDMDMLTISDFRTVPEVKPPSKPSIHQQRARAKPSLYEDHLDTESDERKPLPIRGHPIFRNNLEAMPPGGTPSFLLQQYETSKEIRQVSGIGYSNDLIEHTLRGDAVKTEPMPNIELSHSSSSDSSRTASPSPQHSAKHNGVYKPSTKPLQRAMNGVYKPSTKPLQRAMNRGSNTLNSAAGNNTAAPAPIYDLLNSIPKKNEENTTYRHIFGFKENKPLDINSKLDFPDLN